LSSALRPPDPPLEEDLASLAALSASSRLNAVVMTRPTTTAVERAATILAKAMSIPSIAPV
jgi:hypothetical protein